MIIAPMAINFLGVKVNSIDNNSIITFGPNQYVDQFTSYKRNQGVGEQNGDLSPINIPISWVIDPDLIESNSTKTSVV